MSKIYFYLNNVPDAKTAIFGSSDKDFVCLADLDEVHLKAVLLIKMIKIIFENEEYDS